MPIYNLNESIVFPHPSLADSSGILAIGGDLSVERLLLAYQNGIFPWYNEDDPIIWHAPDPRCILWPKNLKVSKSMRPYFNQRKYSVSYDTCFEKVVLQCALTKRNEPGTWITEDIKKSYQALHEMGIAHSVEVWDEDKNLVGGLYGVAMGSCFIGESMFAQKTNASKFGLISLVHNLVKNGFEFVDCQVYNEHLGSLGAEDIPRDEYMKLLSNSLCKPSLNGNWGEIFRD